MIFQKWVDNRQRSIANDLATTLASICFAILLLAGLSSCSYFKRKKPEGDVIARVQDEYLYASELKSLTKGLKGPDSVEVLKSYAETWIRHKLLLQKAMENISEEDVSIQRKIEDYRETLLLYEYEKELVNQKLDTLVRAQELNDWYEKLKDNYRNESDVYLLYFVKIKKDAPDIDKARKWIMKPKSEEEQLKVQGYAKEFAVTNALDRGMWYDKPTVLKNFPVTEGDLHAMKSGFREFRVFDGTWFIKISGVLREGDPAPLQFVREKIVRAIIEQRRLKLIEKTYDKIYNDGLRGKTFDLYVKTGPEFRAK